MIQTILSAVGVYISTSIDYLFILIIIFSQIKNNSGRAHVYAGQYLGTGVLVGISFIAAYILGFIPEEWILGFLGLIPIYLGLRFAIKGEEDADEEEIIGKVKERNVTQLFWTVTLLTIASGGDNLGIYIPYFSSLNGSEIMIVLAVFAIGIIVLCEVSRYLSKIPFVSETIEKYEQIIVPIVFVLLGLYIMVENNTISTVWNVLIN